jgi:O-antigen/teichoic acid export membrane protein
MLITKMFSFIKETLFEAVTLLTHKKGIKALYSDSLYRNAFYLMLDAAVTALGGFIFWILAARLYSTESVGLASAVISATGLICTIAGLGLGNALIRFLPGSGERASSMINSSMTLSGVVGIIVGAIFLAGIGWWSPGLLHMRESPLYLAMFIFFILTNTLFSFSRTIFVAQRKSGFIFIQGIIANVLRTIPFLLVLTFLTDSGIYASWGLAVLAATITGMIIFLPRAQINYKARLFLDKTITGGMIQYSLANYLVNLLTMASGSILPLIVLNQLGAEQNAYFYIGWTISSMIATIPTAITISLFAEGSNDEKGLDKQIRRSLKFIALLLVPIVIVILVCGKWLLMLYGKEYSQNALILLQVLTLTAFPLAINSLFFTIKRVQKEMKSVIWMNVVIAVITLGMSYFLLPKLGLLAGGIAWLCANLVIAFYIIWGWVRGRRKRR